MNALQALLHRWFGPVVVPDDSALREREAAAEKAANNGFDVLKGAREELDRKSTARSKSDPPPGLDSINSDIDRADDLMRKAFGDG